MTPEVIVLNKILFDIVSTINDDDDDDDDNHDDSDEKNDFMLIVMFRFVSFRYVSLV